MRALITGVTGQDGWYLSRLLIQKGYDVWGLARRSSQPRKYPENVQIVEGDVNDYCCIRETIKAVRPDEVYNLAAMTQVGHSFDVPLSTFDTNARGALNVIDSLVRYNLDAKFYQASTSEMFGNSAPPQNENTPFRPRSPYAIAKLAAYWSVINYRETYGLYACNGILFNHESPHRSPDFVTQKVCTAVANIVKKRQTKLKLGNLAVCRDWGHAEDYVYGMWLMLRQPLPDDYVLATGIMRPVINLVAMAFDYVGLQYHEYVEVDPGLFRKAEVDQLCGDASKAEKMLGWKRKWTFDDMIHEMIEEALKQ